MDLYDAGITALTRFHLNIENKENNNRYWENPNTLAIYRKLIEIGVLLGYHLNPRTIAGLSTDSKDDLSYVYDIEDIPNTRVLERSFAYEITFLYYLNLNSDIYVPILFPPNDYHLKQMLLTFREDKRGISARQADGYSPATQKTNTLPKSPRERLIAILKKNRQVKEWFSNCIR